MTVVDTPSFGITYNRHSDDSTVVIYDRCSENSVWLDLQYCISGFKLFTSHIDKY